MRGQGEDNNDIQDFINPLSTLKLQQTVPVVNPFRLNRNELNIDAKASSGKDTSYIGEVRQPDRKREQDEGSGATFGAT